MHLGAQVLKEAHEGGMPPIAVADSRITCQAGPLIGNAVPPARHPLA